MDTGVDSTFDRLEFFQRMYNQEHRRWDSIHRRLMLPFLIASALLGGYAPILRGIPEVLNEGIIPSVIFFLAIAGSLILLITGIYHLWKARLGYKYFAHLPTAKELDKHWKDLKEYYEKEKEALANHDKKFREYLIEKCRDAADENAQKNDNKSGHVYESLRWLFGSLILEIFSYSIIIMANWSFE